MYGEINTKNVVRKKKREIVISGGVLNNGSRVAYKIIKRSWPNLIKYASLDAIKTVANHFR